MRVRVRGRVRVSSEGGSSVRKEGVGGLFDW